MRNSLSFQVVKDPCFYVNGINLSSSMSHTIIQYYSLVIRMRHVRCYVKNLIQLFFNLLTLI